MSYLETTIKNYSGLSTETKPTIAAGNDVLNGSRWREVDTKDVYFFNLSDDTWYQAQPLIDSSTYARVTIDYGHHEIHEGRSFSASYALTTAATTAHRTGIYLKTQDIRDYHMVVSFAVSTAAYFFIGEAPTIASNVGTHGMVIYNRNRQSDILSTCLGNATVPVVDNITTLTEAEIAGDVTFDIGTILRTAPLSIGDSPRPAGGSGRDAQEYILKQNTAYIFMLQNITAAANSHHILLDWYENGGN